MNHVKNYNDIIYSDLNENINNINLEYLLESFNYPSYQRQTKIILNDIGINLYYITTYGVSVSTIYPFVEKIITKGDFTINPSNENVILMTICAISVLVRENKEKVLKLFKYINKKGIDQNEIDKLINKLKTIKDIFSEISKNMGKVISTFADMLSYTSLLVPFIVTISHLVDQGKIDVNMLSNTTQTLMISLGALGFKLLINRIIKGINFLVNNTSKFKNRENIRPLTINDDFKSPELKKDKVYIN